MEGLTPDSLERALQEEESKVARSRAKQLQMILVADKMQLHTADGCRSLAEWVAGRLDVSRETASSIVRTARRLKDCPGTADQLNGGEITYDRAEATARIAPERLEEDLLSFDIAGLRRIAARQRHLEKIDDVVAHTSQHVTLQPNLDESMWDLWGRLDGYGGSVVNKILNEEADLMKPLPDGVVTGIGYRRAVALTKVCEDRSGGSSGTPLITVFVDGIGAEIEAGPSVGSGLLDKVACTGSLEVVKTAEGKPLSIGRRSRVISKKLKRFVMHRDGGCTADGCTSHYRLQPHHIVPWSELGSTDLENLATLCWFHHHVVVHGWGYRMDVTRGLQRVRFTPSERGPPG